MRCLTSSGQVYSSTFFLWTEAAIVTAAQQLFHNRKSYQRAQKSRREQGLCTTPRAGGGTRGFYTPCSDEQGHLVSSWANGASATRLPIGTADKNRPITHLSQQPLL